MIFHAWEEDGALAFETPEVVNRDTLGFVRRLKRARLLDYISFTTTTPMPGSRLYKTAVKHNLIPSGFLPSDLSKFSMRLPGVSKRAMRRSRLKGMLLQLEFVLRSGRTVWTDFPKLKIKMKYLLESLLP